MKLLDGKTGLVVRFGTLVVALLLGQQAMALGVAADTDIVNVATIDYDVGGIGQDPISTDPDDATFKVDRRVDFTLAPLVPALEGVAPGEPNAWVDFLLTNTSNSTLDFRLALDDLAIGLTVGGDTVDVLFADTEFAVSTELYTGSEADPVQTSGPQFVDELPADEAVRIRVWGDAAAGLANAIVAGVELTATAAEPADVNGTLGSDGSLGADLLEAANGEDTLENVFAETDPDTRTPDEDGVQIAIDGWIVEAAELTVTKAITNILDTFGTDFAIPGAIVTYTITVTNASPSADASNVVITDTLDAGLVFLDMTLDGAPCTELDTDSDGCERTGQALTFDKATVTQGGGTMIAVIRATIDPS